MLVLALIALVFGLVASPFVLPQFVGVGVLPYSVTDGFLSFGILVAILSWIVAFNAAISASARLISRRRDRFTIVALCLSAPGAVLGTIVMAYVTIVFFSFLNM